MDNIKISKEIKIIIDNKLTIMIFLKFLHMCNSNSGNQDVVLELIDRIEKRIINNLKLHNHKFLEEKKLNSILLNLVKIVKGDSVNNVEEQIQQEKVIQNLIE